MMMATISPYIPKIPAMTTGMIDLKMISGLTEVASRMAAPDLAVPKAAPILAKKSAATHPNEPIPTA